MKRKMLAGLVMGLALLMSGCVIEVTDNTGTATKDDSSTFVVVEHNPAFVVVEHNPAFFDVIYHKDTKVMYAVSDGHYNRGSVTLLVDADGKPLLWEE